MTVLFSILALVCDLLSIAIFIRALISWVSPGQTNTLTNLLYQVTEPILSPLRRIVPRVGMFDLTPLAAVIILQLIAAILTRL